MKRGFNLSVIKHNGLKPGYSDIEIGVGFILTCFGIEKVNNIG